MEGFLEEGTSEPREEMLFSPEFFGENKESPWSLEKAQAEGNLVRVEGQETLLVGRPQASGPERGPALC